MKRKTIGEIWFEKEGFTPFAYQKEVWEKTLKGKSGIISVPTGAGKTYAAFLGLLELLDQTVHGQLRILYISPLKALSRDIEKALLKPIEDLKLPFKVETRTGDTPFSRRKKQKIKRPDVLITTPESLSLLLSDANTGEYFQNLQAVIIDEWHELLASKRGCLLELSLAHLKTKSAKKIQIWALSATFGDLKIAAQAALGCHAKAFEIIKADVKREVILTTILPDQFQSLPWSGIFGLVMLPDVIEHLTLDVPTLIFVNARSAAEKWFQALIDTKPKWKSFIRVHHSAAEKKDREEIEKGLKSGLLKIVICTSSLDLGIDFPPLERVIQIGSPKSIARLLQRAGRASHRPMSAATIFIAPTHALELIELTALKEALEKRDIESKFFLKKSYDVLIQHLTSCAIGGGFSKEEMFKEIKSTFSYQNLTMEEFDWCLHFLTYGGKTLSSYSEYRKIVIEDQKYVVPDRQIALRHRMNIGTIVSGTLVQVQMVKGKRLGFLDEDFLSKIPPKGVFNFGGRMLELVQLRDMVAYVRLSKGESKVVPSWGGKFLPLSSSLSDHIRNVLDQINKETFIPSNKEERFLFELAQLQKRHSILPTSSQFLVEKCKTKEGYHIFFYPLEGRAVHEGLAALIAHRLSAIQKATFQTAVNDYGFEILSSREITLDEKLLKNLLSSENLKENILKGIPIEEMARRKFREIAKIAGLIFTGYPGRSKSTRQLQVSSSLLFDVFRKYEPDHLLLKQAKEEVLEENLEIDRLKKTMDRLHSFEIVIKRVPYLTPFSLPLFIEWVSQRLSSESLLERIENLTEKWTS